MISDLPLFEDARTLAAEISSSNHNWSYLKQLLWLSSLLLEKHDLIRKVKLHSEHSLFSPLSFLIHDPRSSFQTPSSLSCMKTQTSRWRYLLPRPHLCKHFSTHQLHVPKHHFLNAHTPISHTRPEFKNNIIAKKTRPPWRNCLMLDSSISHQPLDWESHALEHCKIVAVKCSSFSCPYHAGSGHPWNLYGCFVDNAWEFSGYNLNSFVYPSTCLDESI